VKAVTLPDGRVLAGRVALVTGASGVIGQALARRLAAEGAHVALGYGISAGPASDLAAQITSDGGRAVAVRADLRTPQAPAELVGATEEALGPVDVLVSNADQPRPITTRAIRSPAPCQPPPMKRCAADDSPQVAVHRSSSTLRRTASRSRQNCS
jgi:NAD(P)-dependent dehydrogenase (short-subunit alcohol dehydrogenase family)